MDSFKESAQFSYNPNSDAYMGGAAVLNIYAHHARNIHNICIYANQDVYAKFSLTCNPDETLSTRIINGGGKNPQFEESLQVKITHPDNVLKCEIWMLSRVRNYLEDQLLGFTLVPLSLVAASKGLLTDEFTLSSTDLFNSPAGTVKLTLSQDAPLPLELCEKEKLGSSISSEVELLDAEEYERIEFPDVNIASENQKMVSEYFDMSDKGSPSRAPLLYQLGTSLQTMQDYEMTVNSSDENSSGSATPDGSVGVFSSSTMTSLSDDQNSVKKKNPNSGASPGTPTSKNSTVTSHENEPKESGKMENEGGCKEDDKGDKGELSSVFTSPLGNINLDAEQSAMQQQIVDMYMRSMQQFTESLAKMKLPIEMDKLEDGGDVIQSDNNQVHSQKKDGSRVFYGSRAFF